MNRWKSTAGKKVRGEIREGESQKGEDADAGKGRKVSKKSVFFPTVCGSGGSKNRLAKGAGAEPAGQLRDEKLHTVVALSAIGKLKSVQTHYVRTTCGS